jgi:hypothetical protein
VNLNRIIPSNAWTVGIVAVGLSLAQSPASAENFNLRIAAGHPSAPLSQVNQLNKTFVPNVTRRAQCDPAGGGRNRTYRPVH